jgi:hypothetical protein
VWPKPEDCGAALYYNTAVPVPGQPGRAMKYGVISTHALRQDLLDWTWIYAAGACVDWCDWVSIRFDSV